MRTVEARSDPHQAYIDRNHQKKTDRRKEITMAYILILIFVGALIKEKYDIWKVEEKLKEQDRMFHRDENN